MTIQQHFLFFPYESVFFRAIASADAVDDCAWIYESVSIKSR